MLHFCSPVKEVKKSSIKKARSWMPGWNGDLQSPGDGKLFEDVPTWKLMAVLRKGYYLQQSQSRDSVSLGDKDENVYPLKVRGRILTTHPGSEKVHSIFVLLSRQMKPVWIWAFSLLCGCVTLQDTRSGEITSSLSISFVPKMEDPLRIHLQNQAVNFE